MINSISNTTQIYATSKVNKTTAISAYNDVSSTKPLSRMEQMQEKYKDIYSPMPPNYSKEVEDLQINLIRERYPDYLPLEQALEKYATKIDKNNTQSKEELEILKEEKRAKIVEEHGKDYYTKEVIDPVRVAFVEEILNKHPNNHWDMTKIGGVSNSKELANFYNAGVYEGLESGKNLKKVQSIANSTVINFMDISEYWDFSSMHKKLASQDSNYNVSNQNFISSNTSIDLREYGFDIELHSHNYTNNQQDMLSFSQKKLDYVNFIIDNQNIVDVKFNKLNSSCIRDSNSYDMFVKPAIEYREQAQLAVNIFSKYKIFDSIDVRA